MMANSLRIRLAILMLGGSAISGCMVTQRGAFRDVTWSCAAPTNSIVRDIRRWVADYTTTQSPLADSVRSTHDLPRLPRDSIVAITDPATCTRAGRAYARDLDQHLPPGTYAMAVVRAGDRYVVRGITAPEPAGEWILNAIFDADFHPLASILGR